MTTIKYKTEAGTDVLSGKSAHTEALEGFVTLHREDAENVHIPTARVIEVIGA